MTNTKQTKTPFLACERVSVQFFDRETPVFQEITIPIEEKQSVLLLGPSGCGKSTLAQVLSGLIPRSIEAWTKGTVHRPDRVGVMFQDPDTQFCMLTVEDEIAFSLENRQVPPSEMHDRIRELMAEVGLQVPLTQQISELSGGLKQRLALACMLAQEPDVLFFDEPTAQLDPESTRQVLADIRTLHRQKTIVMIEHKLDGVIEWMDRVVLFGPQGNIIGDGRPEEVFREHAERISHYGIWQPRLWPITWPQLLEDGSQSLSNKLEEQFAKGEASMEARTAMLDNAEPIVEVYNAQLRYKNGHTVWSGVHATVQPGEWVAILGPNGSGKSTFLKMIGGLLTSKSGQLMFKGRPMASYKPEVLYDAVGYVFQNPEHQFIADTVFDEVAFGGKLAGWSAERIQHETNALLADFHLLDLAQKNPFSLSQGQKRRLSVASMLLKQQELLLLDEPTSGQDATTTQELLDRIRERNQNGMTVMMATHDVELVAEYATHVLVFAENSLLFDGTPHQLFTDVELLQRASLLEPLAYEYKRRQASQEEGIGYVR